MGCHRAGIVQNEPAVMQDQKTKILIFLIMGKRRKNEGFSFSDFCTHLFLLT